MRIKHVINDVQSMSPDGEKILKSLQNNYLPLIDIVVREAIQNSLDASIDGGDRTEVNFKIDKFESEKLAPVLEGVSEILIEKHPGYQQYLAISDKNTYGLRGEYSSNDREILDKSDFHKLVFDIGKNQNKEGAGGSWGYGKTSYFRMGVGIVIYYTRIKNDDSYEERLIASVIENPSKPDRLLQNNDRGIAWWGEYPTDDDSRIYPIVNKEKITKILSIFGLKNYTDDETGTTIIIPYLNEIKKESIDEEAIKYVWENDYEDAITMAVQRWYFPRIWNEQYKEKFNKPFLDCKVNKRAIHIHDVAFEPIFKIYQELYTAALTGKVESLKSNIKVQDITLGSNALKNTKEVAGYIAFREVSKEELKMTPPNNKPSGLTYLGIKDTGILDRPMPKVIAYSRKPGMVVEYSVNDLWCNASVNLKEDHILLGFFVPNSDALLNDNFQGEGYKTLEHYLRFIEKSDHANWEDSVDITIVKRIRNRVNQAITKSYQDAKEDESSSATSSISRKFGSMLLPVRKIGNGKTSTIREIDGGKPIGGTKSRGSDISVLYSELIDENTVNVGFKAFIKKESKNHIIIQILTQDQYMDKVSWNKALGTSVSYPFWISNVIIQKINNEEINQEYKDYKKENFEFKLEEINSSIFEITTTLQTDGEIEGILRLKARSNHYVPKLAIRTL